MLRTERPRQGSGSWARRVAAGSVVVFAASLAGCSADIGRFGGSGLGFGDPARTPTASLPPPSEAMQRDAVPYGAPRDPAPYGASRDAGPLPPSREAPVRMSGLPDPTGRPDAGPPLAAPAAKARPTAPAQPRAAAAAPAAAPPAPAIASAPGESIEVQQGDTLYGIAKRHRVAISELMTLNNLQSPNLRPGQKLVLPAGKRAVAARPVIAAAPAQTPAAPVAPVAAARVAAAPAAPAVPPADWTGSYTLAQGDTIHSVARRHNVKAADLQSVNGIADPTKLRPGTALKVPATGGPAAPQTAAAPPAPVAAPAAGGPRPTIINAQPAPAAPGPKVAAVTPAGTATDVTPVAPADTPKGSGAARFRWPVKGKVISNFGPRSDSTHNDGINISVPAGTDVHAAENGVIAYAGNELKGYGNLVLIRHENNWVSAYAHNDQLLVKRGDKVKRGQSIAKAGNSGAVDQPQVHFELRQGSKPVDPLPHMEVN